MSKPSVYTKENFNAGAVYAFRDGWLIGVIRYYILSVFDGFLLVGAGASLAIFINYEGHIKSAAAYFIYLAVLKNGFYWWGWLCHLGALERSHNCERAQLADLPRAARRQEQRRRAKEKAGL